jgi:hypothetical protein
LNVAVTVEPVHAPGSTSSASNLPSVTSAQSRPGQVTLYGEGSTLPVVVSPARSAPLFKSLPIFVTGDANAAKLEAMLASGRTLLLQLCNGDSAGQQFYVQPVNDDSRSWLVSQDQQSSQRYRYVVDLQTVAAP